jgi:hypothetical protein
VASRHHWQEIDENLILRHITSKKQKPVEIDLKLAAMVLEEFQILIGDEPLIVVDEITKKVTVNRHLLPASGPLIINDVTGLPWTANEYRRKWRLVANQAGCPRRSRTWIPAQGPSLRASRLAPRSSWSATPRPTATSRRLPTMTAPKRSPQPRS